MGKIKENRFRLHPSALKRATSSSNINLIPPSLPEHSDVVPFPSATSVSNIFSGINIDINNVAKSLKPSFDTTSVSGRSHREVKKAEQHLPKKEKMRRRHERFMQKLDIYYAKNKQKAKKKKKSPVVGDMEPLLVSLPSISADLPDSSAKSSRKTTIARPCMKAKKRLKEHKNDIKHFRKVLNDAVFKRNPGATIQEFLKQKVAEKRPDLNFEN